MLLIDGPDNELNQAGTCWPGIMLVGTKYSMIIIIFLTSGDFSNMLYVSIQQSILLQCLDYQS
jgi:hypothetical protein